MLFIINHLFITIICIYFILPIDSIFHATDDFSDIYSHSFFITLKQPNLCGGTVIYNPTLSNEVPSTYLWILTAAHCFRNNNEENDIGILSIYHLPESSIQFSISNQVYQHPNFNKTTMDPLNSLFDLALIQIPLSDLPKDRIKEIIPLNVLPYSMASSMNELECIGIGSTSKNESSIDNDAGDILHTTECYSLSNENESSSSSSYLPLNHQTNYLSGIFNEPIKKNQTILTTTFPLNKENNNNISLCFGDSGSPLLLHSNHQDQSPSFIGILSRILYAMDNPSFTCPESSSDLPMINVYVQPYYHLQWISTITKIPTSFFISKKSNYHQLNTNHHINHGHFVYPSSFSYFFFLFIFLFIF